MTIKIDEIEYNTVFIDPSLPADAGDGSSVTAALKDLPAVLNNNTCYIIRRTSEDYKAKLEVQSTAFTNLAFLGMPKETDIKYWYIMDETTKNAWGYDQYEYAIIEAYNADNITHSNNNHNYSSIRSTAIKNFTLLNCYVSRSSNNYRPHGSYGYNPIFMLNNQTATINIHGCKLGYFGIDLEKDDFLNSPTLPEANSTYLYSCRGDCYLYIVADALYISNSTINIYNDNMGGNYCYADNAPYNFHNGLYIKCNKSIFNKNMVNCSSYGANREPGGVYYYSVNDLIACDNEFYYISGNRYGAYYGPIFYFNSGLTKIQSNKCSYKKMVGLAYNTTSGKAFFKSDKVYGLVFNYNSADYGSSTEAAPNLLSVTTLGDSVPGLLKPEFKGNIVTGYKEYSAVKNSPYAIRIDYVYPMHYSNYGFADTYPRPNLSSRIIMEGCKIDCPHGVAIQNLHGLQAKNCEVSGLIKLTKCASLDLNDYKNYQVNTSGITLAGEQNYIRIRNFWIDKDSVNYTYSSITQISSTPASQNMVYIDQSNCDLNNTNRTTNVTAQSQHCAYICPNKGQSGQYWHISSNATCESYNVYRQNSVAKASLKFVNNKSDNCIYPLIIGNEPMKGFLVNSLSSGKKILTAHIAWKNFAAVSNEAKYNERFIMEAKVAYSGENGEIIYKSYYSNMDGYWEDDSSQIWINDTNLTQKSINIPLEITIPTIPIEVKIYHSWYDSTGFCYFDPDIDLIDLS